MTHELLIALGVLAVAGVFGAWGFGRRASRNAVKGVRRISSMTSNFVRALVSAIVISGLELLIVTFVHDWRALLGVFSLPALLAGATLARLFSLNEAVRYERGAGRW